ncbi:MAG: LysM peptidoglycan-binding domain-containing protein [Pseudomonadota bacterium]
MASEITCPICRFEHISPDRGRCPQCDSDLTCFQVLDSLPDEAVVVKTGSWKQGKGIAMTAMGLLLCLAVFVLLSQISRIRDLETLVTDLQTYPVGNKIIGKIDSERLNQRETLPREPGPGGLSEAAGETSTKEREGQPLEDHPMEETEFRIYEADEKDTLWGIAERTYGHGRYYPVLLEHNPHLGIYKIGKGVEIRLLQDAETAGEVYKRITIREGPKLWWTHRIAQGDTLESIAEKYYRTENGIKRILDLNPDMAFTPGEKIKIELE